MRIHILGVCGTFMAGVAIIAKQLGHEVSGSDQEFYPPMSIMLKAHGITMLEGYDPVQLSPTPDMVIIGNALSRGNPCVEFVLNYNLPYTSGPQWLAENVLKDRWVLAITGTHGKTTTTSILAWILDYAGITAGFLIGGVPNNFSSSARVGEAPFFVIEGDEYDSAFFDKRSKFLHYRPRTAILNNLEYDHADIFPDLAALQKQFQYLLRMVPRHGLILTPVADSNVKEVLAKGCWTPVETFGEQSALWRADNMNPDGSRFDVIYNHQKYGTVQWSLLGVHNVNNALAAIAASHHAGVKIETAIAALTSFMGVRRRLELKGQVQGVTVYDDFAHHPTAIAATLAALRARVRTARIIAVVEFASYTMRHGCHGDNIIDSFKDADYVLFLRPSEAADWNLDEIASELNKPTRICDSVDEIVQTVISQASFGDYILIMSNRNFDGIHEKLLQTLKHTPLSEQQRPFFVA